MMIWKADKVVKMVGFTLIISLDSNTEHLIHVLFTCLTGVAFRQRTTLEMSKMLSLAISKEVSMLHDLMMSNEKQMQLLPTPEELVRIILDLLLNAAKPQVTLGRRAHQLLGLIPWNRVDNSLVCLEYWFGTEYFILALKMTLLPIAFWTLYLFPVDPQCRLSCPYKTSWVCSSLYIH